MHSLHITVRLVKLQQVVFQATDRERGGGVFSRGTSAQILGNQLRISSGRNTLTCVYPPWKTPGVQPLRITRRFRRQCLLTSQRTMSRG